MARKAPTSDELFASLDELGTEEHTPAPPPTSAGVKPVAASATEDDDPLAALSALAAQRASARPSTPRLSSSTTSASTNKSLKRADHTPASSGPPSGRTSEDRPRNAAPPEKSSESGRTFHQPFTPATPQAHSSEPSEKPAVHEIEQPPPPTTSSDGGGGGWWGTLSSAASAAVKQAEHLAKDMQQNEEAQRWAEQVKGNISGLQNFGTDLRARALPTFTTLLAHLAPPIAAHERLHIHTSQTTAHFPPLEPLVDAAFRRVMAQVEGGGDALHVSSSGDGAGPAASSGSWAGDDDDDGAWWRDELGGRRSLGAVRGLREGAAVARASAERAAAHFFSAQSGVGDGAAPPTLVRSSSGSGSGSDVFLAVQAVRYVAGRERVAGTAGPEAAAEAEAAAETGEEEEEEEEEEQVTFAVYLHDPVRGLAFAALAQSVPARWAGWLEAAELPQSVRAVVAEGGVDPREWAAGWLGEALGLAVGLVAQRYVARRMGVGEGTGGEGARAMEGGGVAG